MKNTLLSWWFCSGFIKSPFTKLFVFFLTSNSKYTFKLLKFLSLCALIIFSIVQFSVLWFVDESKWQVYAQWSFNGYLNLKKIWFSFFLLIIKSLNLSKLAFLFIETFKNELYLKLLLLFTIHFLKCSKQHRSIYKVVWHERSIIMSNIGRLMQLVEQKLLITPDHLNLIQIWFCDVSVVFRTVLFMSYW